jgi:hypothetical protein
MPDVFSTEALDKYRKRLSEMTDEELEAELTKNRNDRFKTTAKKSKAHEKRKTQTRQTRDFLSNLTDEQKARILSQLKGDAKNGSK